MKNLFILSLLIVLTSCNTSSKNTSNSSVGAMADKAVKGVAAKTVAFKNGVEIGDTAPNFKLRGIDGKEYSFENIMDANGAKPKGYIVIFTCNTCPVAKANEERIIALQNKYAAKGYPVVAIQPNDPLAKPGDSYEKMQTYAKDKGFNFLYLFDDGQKIYPQYGATRTPEVFLVDKDLKVRYHGAIDNSARSAAGVKDKFLENAIQAIDSGKEPSPTTTKAVGCGIKRV